MIRLQFYPVLWCLLIVVLGNITASIAAESELSFKAKSAVNTTKVNKKATAFQAFKKAHFISELDSDASISSSINQPNTQKGETAENAQLEEISYNNLQTESVVQEKNSEKSLLAAQVSQADNATSFKQGMYYGFALMVLLVNILCYFIFDERLFLFYALALSGVTAVFFYNDGLHHLFGLTGPANPFLVQSLLLWFAMGFSALFASKYLNLEEFFPKIKFITFPLVLIGGALVFSAYVAKDTVTAYAANFVSISVLICYFMAGVFLFSRKNYAKFYAIAGFIPLLFAVDFFVLKNIGINFLSTETVHIKIAGLIEMLILTYAIIYRIRAVKEENEMRQTEMRIFLKRQEAMNRQSAVKLLEDVYLENLIMHYDLDGLEIKLLQYISEGKENDKIARKLKTTEEDIEALTKELYEKLEIGEQIQEDFRLLDSQPDYLYN
ncbi:7TM-DISM domain-containing protein [Rasiella rasia]|uniref:7TM-DISM domain-containing protein n=1 Tax=Rasiella rasia TaxID=2744027 RepID=A0A6G6GKB2_9FLAO|nr:7TM-DISM domain-containing protein [Rasiella rasia]QIE58957.1 7TM-DISM domain-containing protein [Rasiella rasia]